MIRIIFVQLVNSIESAKVMKILQKFNKFELSYWFNNDKMKDNQSSSFQDMTKIHLQDFDSFEQNLNYGTPLKYSQEYYKSSSIPNFEDYYFTPPKVANTQYNSYPYNSNLIQHSYQFNNEASTIESLNLYINTNYHPNYSENYINDTQNNLYPLFMNPNINVNLNSTNQFSSMNSTETNKTSHNPNRKKHKMDQIEELEKNKINLEMITQKVDKRTTLMIKNIPYKMHKDHVLKLIEKNFSKKYDFFIFQWILK